MCNLEILKKKSIYLSIIIVYYYYYYLVSKVTFLIIINIKFMINHEQIIYLHLCLKQVEAEITLTDKILSGALLILSMHICVILDAIVPFSCP